MTIKATVTTDLDKTVTRVTVPGPMGPPSIVPGPQGDQGIQGIQGDQGIQGIPGEDRISYASDIDISNLEDGSILMYSTSNSEWIAKNDLTPDSGEFIITGGNF
jgi:hypothetical protein